MKVYLDTTVLIAFLFGELSDVEYDAHFARVSAVTALRPEEFVESVAQLDREQML
jgi:hypothetical protein